MTFPWPRIDVPEKDVQDIIEMMRMYAEVEDVEVIIQDDGTYTLIPKRKPDYQF